MLAYAGRGKTSTAPVDVNTLVGETAQLVKLSLNRKAVLEPQFASELPAVRGDASQLRQVVMNLLMNASEAIGEIAGRIAVTTGVTKLDEGDWAEFVPMPDQPASRYVFIEVSDDGCGMSSDVLSRIFNPFYTTKFTGRGLGLSAVHGILRAHGGAIRVRSELGRGTTFRVVLPAEETVAAVVTPRETRPRKWSNAGVALLVDDDNLVRMAATSMLELLGFSVLQATDGDEVLTVLREAGVRPRVVLIDLTMARRHGIEALSDVRSVHPDVPVLMMSGYSEDDALRRLGDLRCSGFLEKPFSVTHLRSKLEVVLGDGDPAPAAISGRAEA
jgi:CheY-like chemotaxis protein